MRLCDVRCEVRRVVYTTERLHTLTHMRYAFCYAHLAMSTVGMECLGLKY